MTSERKANRGPSAGPENRRAILSAAREVFAIEGVSAPLNAVARRAGVGQGSLYRHFPDRVALVVAVIDENIVELEALAETPGSTLDDLVALVAEQAIVSTAFADLLVEERDDPRVAHIGTRFRAVADAVTDNDRRAGRLGAGVSTEDVMLGVEMLAGVLSRTPAIDRPATAARATALLRAAFDRR
ncbi:TetR/AcrR family transcriptional regulator [Labedella endophytica]|uniref:TetR/AcrR family transcriptional regulator n=1 Tax=Labedella endophytica TaxID=1523160 RepID=A0A433JSC9_9MICO|nr:TetR/AcrR family transcriptional regulator [Labedella endophytica]RUR00947.1 TetR/AcrR family transcriptional regulator [Labedella endophytica]